MNTIFHQILRFPHGPFFPSLFSFFTSSYNFEVNRHEKVGQKRETANCEVEVKKTWIRGLFLPSFSLRNTNVQFSWLPLHCICKIYPNPAILWIWGPLEKLWEMLTRIFWSWKVHHIWFTFIPTLNFLMTSGLHDIIAKKGVTQLPGSCNRYTVHSVAF